MTLLGFAFAAYGVSTLTAMAPMSIAAAFLFATIILRIYGSKSSWRRLVTAQCKSLESRQFISASALLVLACSMSLLGGLLFPLSYGGKTAEVHFLKDMAKAWYFAWPWVLAIGLSLLKGRERKTAFATWLLAYAAFSILGITQHFTGWPRPQAIPGNDTRFHATVFLGHHLSVASIFIFPFFVTLGLSRGTRGPKWLGLPRLFFMSATFLGGLTLFLTYSRMLWVALPLGILVWAVLSLPKKQAWSAVAVLLLATIATTQLPFVKKRIHDSMGVDDRQALWEANLNFFKERPLTGVGIRKNEELSGYYLLQKHPGTSVFSGHAHNNFIEMLAGAGLLGVIAWILWSLAAIKITQKIGLLAPGLLCAWLVFHLNGLTQVNFWEGKVQHQMMWILGWALFSASHPEENPAR